MESLKNKFVQPQIEVICLLQNDVIATSNLNSVLANAGEWDEIN